MSIQRKHGQWGEDLAAGFLLRNGLKILCRNYRYKRAEIDIIAMDGEILVFVEVKTKSSTGFGRPELKVGRIKKNLLIDAGMAYMRLIGHEWEIRFDIIAIVGSPDSLQEVIHYKDAFFPGLDYSK